MITMTLRRAAVTACVSLAALGLLVPGVAQAGTEVHPADPPQRPSAAPSLTLPRPTGPYGVGSDTLHLVDAARPDPWVPEAGPRELMVSMYYPARRASGTPTGYVTPHESELILTSQGVTDVPADILSTVRTYARSGAAPRAGRHDYPLVVLSPGFSFPRTSLTALAEDLASNGYVVAAVEHTYESVATTFPDGHVTTCVACEADTTPQRIIQGRAADVSFVLDELVGPHPAWRLARLIAPARIGMAGHSIGGASGGSTAARDPRVRAAVNLDGTQFDPLPETGLDVPFMFLGTEDGHSPGGGEDTTWDRDWQRLTGWKRWVTVSGSGHSSFTDYGTLADQLGVDIGQTIAGDRAVRITNAYVGAFFDQHLRGRHRPLLDGPSRTYPEVRFRP
ncbi:alpha/beta hydrolase family protein [Actinopolymorpha rutila]|uniref:Putative dienelactone hydrolase n=1 Tax=Actinopolymorpha rutila TaxID=446787 RepID=A0A852ZMT4_9ACTN|nr:lipase [Actinopolymorpha rutila]NYH93198.1 putative dienelactone hydrolase [Actinopolymorpha rutila]